MSKPLDDIFSALLQQDFNNSLIDIIAEVNRNTEKAAMFNKMLNEAIAKENFDAFSVAIDKLYQQKFNDKGTDKELKLQIDRDFRKILIHSNILNSIFDKMVEKKNAAKVQQEAPVPFSPIPQPSVINRDFNDFIARLQQSKLEAPGEAFSKLVSPLARDQILNFFLIRHDPSTRANLSSEQYDKINKILAEIETLKPGEMLRLDKKETTLPRTLNILRGEDGEYKLIVETKSRLSDDTKQVLPKIAGTTKSGKPAWRIDGDEMEYFSLVASLDYDEKEIQRQIARGYTREEVLAMFREEDVGKLKVEVDISKETKGEQVQENILGKQYTNKGKTKITVYSVKAKGSLELLTKHSVSSKLSDQQKDTLILELLQGIKVFHDKGYVHQDLKPGNILIYGDDTNGYHLKLTDFGLTRKHGDISEEGLSTSAYHSPETAYYYLSDTDSSKYNYYNGPYSKATLANQLYHYNPQLFPADGSKRAQVRTPDFANDMWAAGVIIFQIRYGRLPNINDMPLINQDPLLSKLLTPDRSQRFNIASALALQQMIQPLVGDKTFQKYSTTFQNTEVGKKFWEIFKMGAIVNGKFALTKDLEHAILYNLDPQTKNNLTILEKIQLAKDLKEVFSKQPGANETDINEALDTCVLRATSALHAEYKQKGIPIPPSLAQNQKKPYRDPVPKVSTKQKILKLDPNRFVEKVGKAKGDIFAQREHKKIDRDRDMVISSSRREATLVSPKAMFELQRMRTAYINNANLYDVAKLPPSPLLAAAQEIINDARIKQVSKKSDPKKLPDQSERMLNDVFITTDSPLGIQLGLKYPVMIGKNGQMIAIMETDQQKLGQGAFGQVFLGMDLDSGKLVAVKYQTPQTDAKRKEVMEERDKLENLNRLIDSIDHENSIIIVDELGWGKDMTHSIEDMRREPYDTNVLKRVEMSIGFLEQIELLHQEGLLHRDIKTDNMLWDDVNKKAKIIDFGCSGREEEFIGKTNDMVGTPIYISPEVIGGIYNKQTDIYACGVALIEIFSTHDIFVHKQVWNNIAIEYFNSNPKDPSIITDFFKQAAPDLFEPNVNPQIKPIVDMFIQMIDPDMSKRPSLATVIAAMKEKKYELEFNEFMDKFKSPGKVLMTSSYLENPKITEFIFNNLSKGVSFLNKFEANKITLESKDGKVLEGEKSIIYSLLQQAAKTNNKEIFEKLANHIQLFDPKNHDLAQSVLKTIVQGIANGKSSELLQVYLKLANENGRNKEAKEDFTNIVNTYKKPLEKPEMFLDEREKQKYEALAEQRKAALARVLIAQNEHFLPPSIKASEEVEKVYRSISNTVRLAQSLELSEKSKQTSSFKQKYKDIRKNILFNNNYESKHDLAGQLSSKLQVLQSKVLAGIIKPEDMQKDLQKILSEMKEKGDKRHQIGEDKFVNLVKDLQKSLPEPPVESRKQRKPPTAQV